jgi:hypothetical protein
MTFDVISLGSAIGLACTVQLLMHQLGVYEEFVNIGLVSNNITMFDENAKLDYVVDYTPSHAM